MMVPPQRLPPARLASWNLRETIHGHEFGRAGLPLTILLALPHDPKPGFIDGVTGLNSGEVIDKAK